MAGIYVHIPLCKSKCIYCGFYSKPLSLFNAGKLADAIVCEAVERSCSTKIETVYFGGGTPSVLNISELQKIVDALHHNFNISPDAEFTVEVNPDDITPSYARALKELGVNRISMGVQSFEDEHLKWMRRRHSALDVVNAFGILREAGFSNISLDLIFGFKGLSTSQLESNLEKLIALNPEHISTYQLSIDPGSILEKLSPKGENFLLGDADCGAQYALIQNRLQAAGYEQYEVSNFAREGKVSCHNSNYWRRIPYIGLGPGAHSFAGTHREWNNDDISGYLAYYSGNKDVAISGCEDLSAQDIFTESVMLGLRRCDGVSEALLSRLAAEAGVNCNHLQNAVEEQIALGNIVRSKTDSGEFFIRIPPEKMFVSDSIILNLL